MTASTRSRLLAQVSITHLTSHLHMLTLPALLPVLPAYLDVSFIELGVALSVFNVVSALVQTPMGFAVDRFGARKVLLFGLLLGSAAFALVGAFGHYWVLLLAMALAGIANGVYHPGDYALLSQGMPKERMGRAFSIHTFAGYLGSALAPVLILGTATLVNVSAGFFLAAVIGFASAAYLARGEMPVGQARKPAAGAAKASGAPIAVLLSPAILSLTLLFVLLSLSTGAIQNFSVTALNGGFAVPLATANTALTAFLFASAFGVLAGGVLADRTQRHGLVSAGAYLVAAALVAIVAMAALSGTALVIVLGITGFLTGLIAPSRDMLVRAASPAGAEGRVFGFVSTGFNIGGAVGPIAFAWLIDTGRHAGIFWASMGFMLLVVAMTLAQELRTTRPVAVAEASGR
ncbi:MFS transporter [Achromobacter sp. GG226]|uniref:MFS transporter n=1 Tax=Verticiella alkaliphila TaxID=2779529 RepID=UPI001C0E8054|nr:MFS transporter [Verticiella sp. GG226]MBU4610131.1 MFS transporter [Verticiella sp. GG226]